MGAEPQRGETARLRAAAGRRDRAVADYRLPDWFLPFDGFDMFCCSGRRRYLNVASPRMEDRTENYG